MAFEYGFYDAIEGDRKYTARDFGKLFDGLISDGIFEEIGNKFFTTCTGTDMKVSVGTGKAWFNHTYSLNTSPMVFTLAASHPVMSRYDMIVLEVNDEPVVDGRKNEIKLIEGTVSSNPEKPTLVNSTFIHQYPLAYIKINAGVEAIVAGNIEIMVGQDPCPFVTGIVETADITDLFAAWNNQFTTWFDNLKSQLSGDVVANIQNQLDTLSTSIDAVDEKVDGVSVVSQVEFAPDCVTTYKPGYILANGDYLSTEDYPELFSKIGYAYGNMSYESGELILDDVYDFPKTNLDTFFDRTTFCKVYNYGYVKLESDGRRITVYEPYKDAKTFYINAGNYSGTFTGYRIFGTAGNNSHAVIIDTDKKHIVSAKFSKDNDPAYGDRVGYYTETTSAGAVISYITIPENIDAIIPYSRLTIYFFDGGTWLYNNYEYRSKSYITTGKYGAQSSSVGYEYNVKYNTAGPFSEKSLNSIRIFSESSDGTYYFGLGDHSVISTVPYDVLYRISKSSGYTTTITDGSENIMMPLLPDIEKGKGSVAISASNNYAYLVKNGDNIGLATTSGNGDSSSVFTISILCDQLTSNDYLVNYNKYSTSSGHTFSVYFFNSKALLVDTSTPMADANNKFYIDYPDGIYPIYPGYTNYYSTVKPIFSNGKAVTNVITKQRFRLPTISLAKTKAFIRAK